MDLQYFLKKSNKLHQQESHLCVEPEGATTGSGSYESEVLHHEFEGSVIGMDSLEAASEGAATRTDSLEDAKVLVIIGSTSSDLHKEMILRAHYSSQADFL